MNKMNAEQSAYFALGYIYATAKHLAEDEAERRIEADDWKRSDASFGAALLEEEYRRMLLEHVEEMAKKQVARKAASF